MTRRRALPKPPGMGLGGLCAILLLGWSATLTAAEPVAAGPPDAATVLRRADLVRNPYLGTALEIDLSVRSRTSGRELRESRYTMLTHRRDRTLILVRPSARTGPGAVLIADDAYWVLPPQSERPVELPLRYVVAGDLSHAGFLRFNLRLHHQPRHDGEETLGDVPCWRLELAPKRRPAPFARVRYWVAQRDFRPIRLEFYAERGELLKTVWFTEYREAGGVPRPARIEIEDTGRPDERATLRLSRSKGIGTATLEFDLKDLIALRDAARRLAGEDTEASADKLVEALRNSQPAASVEILPGISGPGGRQPRAPSVRRSGR